MCDYLIDIQTTCDSLASCGQTIEKLQQISIIFNGVKGQHDNVIFIHANMNPYDIASISTILLDAESRQSDMLFDESISTNVALNHSSATMSTGSGFDSHIECHGQGNKISDNRGSTSNGLLPTTYAYENQNFSYERGCVYGNNKPQCQICEKFGDLVHRCFHRFNIHFTGVIDLGGASGTNASPRVHLCSTQ